MSNNVSMTVTTNQKVVEVGADVEVEIEDEAHMADLVQHVLEKTKEASEGMVTAGKYGVRLIAIVTEITDSHEVRKS